MIPFYYGSGSAKAKLYSSGSALLVKFFIVRSSVLDRHRFDADPYPTFHYDADPDPDPTSVYTQVENQKFSVIGVTIFGISDRTQNIEFSKKF